MTFMVAAIFADMAFNRPIDDTKTPRAIYSDPRPATHRLTTSLNNFEIGFLGFSYGKHTSRTTDFIFGKRSLEIPLSIYTVVTLVILGSLLFTAISFQSLRSRYKLA